MMRVKVFSVKSCSYCDKIKNLLINDGIEFIDYDIDDVKNKDEVEFLGKSVKLDYVPILMVDKLILVPETSFKTIDQAFSIINKLLSNN